MHGTGSLVVILSMDDSTIYKRSQCPYMLVGFVVLYDLQWERVEAGCKKPCAQYEMRAKRVKHACNTNEENNLLSD